MSFLSHLVVFVLAGAIVAAAVVAVTEVVTGVVLALEFVLPRFVRSVRAAVSRGRGRSSTSGPATAPAQGWPWAVAPTPGALARTSRAGGRAGLKPSPFLEERMTTTIDSFAGDDWSVLFPPGDVYGTEYSGTYSVHDAAQVEDITPERIARIDASYLNEGDYAETDLAALVELTDGTWAAVMAWCDTTGWGCQSGVQWKWGRTREDVISQGLDNAAREAMGLETEPTTSTPERSA